MFDIEPSYEDQSGVGTADPMHVMRVRPPGNPVVTDGAASNVGSSRLRNSPRPPRIDRGVTRFQAQVDVACSNYWIGR